MALPEGYTVRRGDVVTLRACVVHDFEAGDDYVHVKFDGAHSIAVIKPETIVSLACRAWRIGEAVMPTNRIHRYETPALVLSIHEEYVWIDDPHTGPATYHANSLKAWVDPKAPLIMDEAALQELTEVQEAMKEPPPAPLPPGSSAKVGDDDEIDF